MSFEEYHDLSRQDKDAINSLLFGLNTHGILVSKDILSLELVTLFYQQLERLKGLFLRLVKIPLMHLQLQKMVLDI